ncbi:galactosyltransferase-related protein [uncultured Sulfitobacter sp.]|uniref:glycosyltransferase family 2 protein n=1 Tax=uncultured Sulfitobacter sp. TaxID=191468 RepID=UPI002611462A|nr:galactosyltransferase-related protein [uncultured Sulfitobacter sp.]
MTISVCTIARGRDAHLRNLIAGLAQQTVSPQELVIAYMQDAPYVDLPSCPFPVRQVAVEGEQLPLAAARNAAAEKATGDTLVFIDADCIPLPNLIAAYVDVAAPDRCLMGETRYLARMDDPEPTAPRHLWQMSQQHPARRFSETLGPGTCRIPEVREFWSLSFSLSKPTFHKMNGFDEDFAGYGGEDTDFAMKLDFHGIGLWWVPEAQAVHQWHPVQKPPLTQFDDIIRNARRFRHKHGIWCMEYWLDQFEAKGFIKRDADMITIQRRPSPDESEAAICDGSVRFS